MNKELRQLQFSAEHIDTVNTIVDATATLCAAAAYRDFGKHGIVEKVILNDYNAENEKVKKATIAFASKMAGIEIPTTKSEFSYAMESSAFRDVMNTITARTIGTMMVRYDSPQIGRIAEIETVGAGESRSYEIDTKALPIAQKATYGSNVSLVPPYAMQSVTVTPKPYTLGTSLDYIRIIGNGYDWGRAVARVYAGMLFAQYQLVINKVFATATLTGTPFLIPTFAPATYVQAAEDLGMLNGGSSSSVLALGTQTAWQAISALATQGGFTTKDEYIENAFLQKIYGVDSMIIDQFSNYAAPFTSANASSLRAVPNNYILLVSRNQDKICKLVREDYIRVIDTAAINNTANRNEYTFFQNFDAAIATASWFALQSTSSAG